MSWIQATRNPQQREPDDGDFPRARERWHVGREIPLALIFTIMMSVGSGIWYASKTDARIMLLEKTQEQNGGLRDDIVALKEQIKNIDRLLQRVENVLDRRTGEDAKEDKKKLGGLEQ